MRKRGCPKPTGLTLRLISSPAGMSRSRDVCWSVSWLETTVESEVSILASSTVVGHVDLVPMIPKWKRTGMVNVMISTVTATSSTLE